MEGVETMPIDGRKLILEAAGGFRPGERPKGLLRRLAQDVDVGFRSLEQFWKGQYGSKNTISKLTEKANERARNNEDKVAAKLELAAELEALACEDELAGRLEVVGILRAAAHTLRDEDDQTGTGEVNE